MKGRKVNLVGRDTLTISLPKNWVERNSIKRGMELEIEDSEESLIIHSGHDSIKETTIDVGEMSTFLLNKCLNNVYIQNIDNIIINFDKSKIYNHESEKEVQVADYITDLVNMYIGLEIISQSDKRIVIQNLIKERDIKSLSLIQKRTHSLFIELINVLCENIKNEPIKFESSIKSQITNVRKFIYYCIRLIVSSDSNTVNKIKWYVLYDHLDNSLFNIERIVSVLSEKKKISSNLREMVLQIFKLFLKYLCLDPKTTSQINELILERYHLLKKIKDKKISLEEEKILRETKIFLNIHHDFVLIFTEIK